MSGDPGDVVPAYLHTAGTSWKTPLQVLDLGHVLPVDSSPKLQQLCP